MIGGATIQKVMVRKGTVAGGYMMVGTYGGCFHLNRIGNRDRVKSKA